MRVVDSGMVDIVRHFLVAHRAFREVARGYRAGDLTFEQVQELVGDGEQAVLYRLKESSHFLFRGQPETDPLDMGPGLLFDLAVGSLFHEAMKFRENFYQRASYGPKVRALRSAAVPDASGLLHEFEKILEGTSVRLDESLQEAETLLAQIVGQFHVLLTAHTRNGFVTRFLIENREAVEAVFGRGLDDVLAEIHGSAGVARVRAADSYLVSGYFAEAASMLEEASLHGEQSAETKRLRAYAVGMQEYLEGHYHAAVELLGEWIDAEPGSPDARRVDMAYSALSRVGQLLEPGSGDAIIAKAAQLAERIRPLRSVSRGSAEISP